MSNGTLVQWLRALVLERVAFNLAAVLGVTQAAILHWLQIVVGGALWPSVGIWVVALVLVLLNSRCVPLIRTHRWRTNWQGAFVRRYVDFGVATLLVSIVVFGSFAALAGMALVTTALGSSVDSLLLAFRIVSPLAVLAAGATVGLGFVRHERVATTSLRIPIRGLADEHSGLRIAQISDLHIGNHLEGDRLARMVDRVNELEPDMIAITGDIFDFEPSVLESGSRGLERLESRLGNFAILGNHDVAIGADTVASALASFAPSIRLLRDEIVRIPSDEPLYIAGIEDAGGRWFERELRYASLDRVACARPADGVVLLLAHQPEIFLHASELEFPLVLVGHTHGGQMSLPGGRWNLARVMTPFTRGLYQAGVTRLYVNRGLGVGGPALRINCPREIALIELEVAASS